MDELIKKFIEADSNYQQVKKAVLDEMKRLDKKFWMLPDGKYIRRVEQKVKEYIYITSTDKPAE